MATLKILFQGICSHFTGVVPWIPHRVVLPDASAFRFGLVDLPERSGVEYFLMPHFAVLRTIPSSQELMSIPGVMETGNIFDGVRIQVANASGNGVSYEPAFFEKVPQITSFVPAYVPSDEVVTGNRAICHVDLFSASVTKFTNLDLSESVIATIATDGLPELLVTPFSTAGTAAHRIVLNVDEEEKALLIVANQGIDCQVERENNFDFLLHYITSRTGIPRVLDRPTPGLTQTPASFTPLDLDTALVQLQTFALATRFSGPCFTLDGVRWDTSAACSDTRYP
ncbi:MAG TPA: hypothetical protein VEK57_23765 [Thermoanaerobaculia bacterium]|nr:hypothetical protein [Thermoanaerobaculia bacterium]